VLGDLLQDLRYARRTLAARPGFTMVATLSLALGIGANTAIFSLWNGVLHASLPAVHIPEQLVMLSNPDEAGMWFGRTDGPRSWLTYGEFEQLRDHAEGFSALMASQSSLSTWQVRFEGGEQEEANGRLVSGGFFQVLGVGSAIGRVFTVAEDRTETPGAVMSYRYWQRRFGGRPDVLGKTLTVGNAALTIIGVASPGFIGETSGQQPDLWLPLRTQPRVMSGNDWLRSQMPNPMSLRPASGLAPTRTPCPSHATQTPVAPASGPESAIVTSRSPWQSGQMGSVKWSSASASLPGGLPLSFGVILMVSIGSLFPRFGGACQVAGLPLEWWAARLTGYDG
jgi:hypothetical protein